jgi:hypothetical protein
MSENEYMRLDDETVNEIACYVLEITPKKEAKSTYAKHVSWIAKDGLYGVQEKSYDKREELKKRKEFTFQKMKNYYVIERVLWRMFKNNIPQR